MPASSPTQISNPVLSQRPSCPYCPYCQSRKTTRKGWRKNKFGKVQMFFCKPCSRVFTPGNIRSKIFPASFILDALSFYNQGFSAPACCRLLKEKHGLSASDSAIEVWVKEFKGLCSFHRLRDQVRRLYSPHQLIRKVKLYHRQVYEYALHRGKLDLLLGPNAEHARFAPLGKYLKSMLLECPHALFCSTDRASSNKASLDLSRTMILAKQNSATRLAGLVLPTVRDNYKRHEALQNFFLLNDSVTVAVEVPVYFLPEDLRRLRQTAGFNIPFAASEAITGHIDFLQIRNGLVHILDYKPDAKTNKPIGQLTIYALALSRLTGLRLFNFKCAWFNQDGYYEFYPLHVVYKKPVIL